MNSMPALVSYRAVDWMDWLPQARYRVGDDGSVWSLARGTWKRLKERKRLGKGPRVKLTGIAKKRAVAVSVLVCRAFHGPRPIGCEPYHFPDPNPENNRASNLRWAPKGARSIGTVPTIPAIKAGRRNLKAHAEATRSLQEPDVPRVFALRREGWTLREIAQELSTSANVISNVLTGRVYGAIICDRSVPDGLARRGDMHPAAKLTSLDVLEIRRKRANGMSFGSIAQQYGVSYNAIHQIFQRRTWTHVFGDADVEPWRDAGLPTVDQA